MIAVETCSTLCHVSMAQLPFPQFISEIYPNLWLFFNRIHLNNVQTNSRPCVPVFLSLPTITTCRLETEFSQTCFRQVRCDLASYMAALQCCMVASQWQKAMLLGQTIMTKTLDVEVPWLNRRAGFETGCYVVVHE